MNQPLLSKLYATPEYHQPPADKLLANDLNYPNLNSCDFATRPENLTQRMQDCWECLAVSGESDLAVATNKRHGNEWWGEFFGFNQCNDLVIKRATFKRQCRVPISKMQFAGDNLLLVGRTDSKLQAWSTFSTLRNPNDPYCLFLVDEKSMHDNPINNLTVFRTDKIRAITTCIEGRLNVWNLGTASIDLEHTIKMAHNSSVCDVDTSYTRESVFATCGDDLVAKLWDIRKAQPATTIYKEAGNLKVTTLAWATPSEQNADNLIYLGDYDGNVHTLDIRVPNKFTHTESYFQNSAITKICINSAHMAVIGNNPAAIKISKSEQHRIIYKCAENTHVRILDATWYNDHTLLTCGYGRKYQVHKINQI